MSKIQLRETQSEAQRCLALVSRCALKVVTVALATFSQDIGCAFNLLPATFKNSKISTGTPLLL